MITDKDRALADRIVTLLEGRYREWLSKEEYAACIPEIQELLAQHVAGRVRESEKDKAHMDWLEEQHATLEAFCEDHGDEILLWWRVVKDGISISGHPLPTARAAIDAAMKGTT